MTEFEELEHGPYPTLEELLGFYNAGDDIGKGIEKAELKTSVLMRLYPNGVPSGVMFAGTVKAQEWTTDLILMMLVEIAAAIRGWDEEEEEEQLGLSLAVSRLLTAHAMNVILAAYLPTEKGER